MSEKTAVQLMSENIVNTRFNDLSEWNVQNAKNRFIDIIGCIIGGAKVAGNAGLVEIVKDWGGKEEAPLFIHGGRVPAGNAAMVNCLSGRSNDFGAMYTNYDGKRIPSQISSTTIPTALTMGDAYAISGMELITATVLGDDVASRVVASGGFDFDQGWDGSLSISLFGALPIACRIMGLSAEQVRNAFGIGVNMVSGSIQNIWDGGMYFKNQGVAARNGIFAAELAQKGWTGLKDAFCGGKGYYYLYRRGKPVEPEKLTYCLGEKYFTEESFKRFPCGIPTTPIIIACKKLYEKYRIQGEELEALVIGLSPDSTRLYYVKPFTLEGHAEINAMFSFQYAAACTLLHGNFKIQDLAIEAIGDEKIQELIAKSSFEDMPDTSRQIRIRLRTKSGVVYEQVEDLDKSMHEYPTKEEIESKYWDQVEAFNNISKAKAQKILDLVYRIEDVGDIREISGLLMP